MPPPTARSGKLLIRATRKNMPAQAIALVHLAQRGLTLRSRRGPTASHQARAGGTLHIFTSPGPASCRWSRLNSNVRPRKQIRSVLQQSQRLSARTEQPRLGKAREQRQVVLAAKTTCVCRQPDTGFFLICQVLFSVEGQKLPGIAVTEPITHYAPKIFS